MPVSYLWQKNVTIETECVKLQ